LSQAFWFHNGAPTSAALDLMILRERGASFVSLGKKLGVSGQQIKNVYDRAKKFQEPRVMNYEKLLKIDLTGIV
jgi:F420-0:gamma-glutamyl ligase-like protein